MTDIPWHAEYVSNSLAGSGLDTSIIEHTAIHRDPGSVVLIMDNPQLFDRLLDEHLEPNSNNMAIQASIARLIGKMPDTGASYVSIWVSSPKAL